jgi:hypothetical protein
VSATFRTELILGGKTATGVRVPVDVVEGLGSGKRPAVTVTINGYSYPSTVAVMGGDFMLPVSAEVRAAAGVAAGDVIDVTVALDSVPREVVVPDDLAVALAADGAASTFFGTLSYSNKRRIVLQIEGAKTDETRRRRVEKAVAGLREGRVA